MTDSKRCWIIYWTASLRTFETFKPTGPVWFATTLELETVATSSHSSLSQLSRLSQRQSPHSKSPSTSSGCSKPSTQRVETRSPGW